MPSPELNLTLMVRPFTVKPMICSTLGTEPLYPIHPWTCCGGNTQVTTEINRRDLNPQ